MADKVKSSAAAVIAVERVDGASPPKVSMYLDPELFVVMRNEAVAAPVIADLVAQAAQEDPQKIHDLISSVYVLLNRRFNLPEPELEDEDGSRPRGLLTH